MKTQRFKHNREAKVDELMGNLNDIHPNKTIK
jgi:hypothetical protein